MLNFFENEILFLFQEIESKWKERSKHQTYYIACYDAKDTV